MIKNIDGLIAHLTKEIKDRTDVAVIGLSGGADSTLVATLCMLALGRENVVGVHMPYGKTDTEGTKFNARSVRLARKLRIVEKYIPITKIADDITAAIDTNMGKIELLDHGNARARARMCVLYGLSGTLHHDFGHDTAIRVIGTGNLSEDILGFETKFGDSGVDFHPIGRLFKSEVYQLLNHFIVTGVIDEEHVDRVPSPGLWDGHTAEGELGYRYDDMEPIIKTMIPKDRNYSNGITASDTNGLPGFIQRRYWANRHKLISPPVIEVEGYVD